MNTSRFAKMTLAAAAISICFSGSAVASILYDNITPSNSDVDVLTNLWWGQGFIPPVTGALGTIEISLAAPTNTSGGFFVQLRADAAGLPGAVMEVLTGPANPPAGIITYTSNVSPVLTAGTGYWVVGGVGAALPSHYNWTAETTGPTPTIGTAIGAAFSLTSGVTWMNAGNDLSLNVRVNSASAEPAVPEVASWLIWSLGAIFSTLGVMYRRQRGHLCD